MENYNEKLASDARISDRRFLDSGQNISLLEFVAEYTRARLGKYDLVKSPQTGRVYLIDVDSKGTVAITERSQ